MITASFTRARQRETGGIRMRFLPILQEVKPMSKTRNRLNFTAPQFGVELPFRTYPPSMPTMRGPSELG